MRKCVILVDLKYAAHVRILPCKRGLGAAEKGASKVPTRRPNLTYAYYAQRTRNTRGVNLRVNRTKPQRLSLLPLLLSYLDACSTRKK